MNTIIAALVGLLGLVSGAVIAPRISDTPAPPPPLASETTEQPDAIDYVSARPYIASLPSSTVSPEERASLIFMREEEKLARDVYSVLYDRWQLPIFANIAQSEQTHTEAVRTLLEKYEIADPVTDDSVGIFVNQDLQALYAAFTAQGSESAEAALRVGATIEDLDLRDLAQQGASVDNDDIQFVYENLARGSRNHLRAFSKQLSARGETYTPIHISPQEYDVIMRTAQEKGAPGAGAGKRRGWGN